MTSADPVEPTGADEPLRDVERLTYFSDAVIAIAVTLLVLPLADAASADEVTSLGALVDESGGEIFVFLPYATELLGQNGGDRSVVTGLYMGTMLVTSSASLGIQWLVIRTPTLRKPGVREPRLVLGFATAGVFLFAFLLALVAPEAAPYALLLLIPSSQIASRRTRRTPGPAGPAEQSG